MKNAGIILLMIGLVITMVTGFDYVSAEKIIDIGDVKVTADRTQTVSWSPMIGVVVMLIGGVIYLTATNKNK